MHSLVILQKNGQKTCIGESYGSQTQKKKAGRQLEGSTSYTLVHSCKIANGSQQLTQYGLLRFPIFPSQMQFHHRTDLTGIQRQ